MRGTRLLNPLTAQPAVVKVEGRLGLVHGNHVAGSEDLHEGKVSAGLDLSVLAAVNLETLDVSVRETLGARPLQGVGPGLVSEPVADVVGIAGVDEDRDLLEKLGHKVVEGLEPVTGKEEIAVDVHVAAVVAINFGTKSLHDLGPVQVLRDPSERGVAEVAAVLALAADVVNVLSSALVGADESVIAVDAGRHTGPGAPGIVAALDKRLAAGERVVHRLAFALGKYGGVATITAGHGAVVGVLCVSICQAVADQDTL